MDFLEEGKESAFEDFMLRNRPCLIGEWVSKNWNCRKKWAVNGRIDLHAVKQALSDVTVPVINCNEKDDCSTVGLHDFIQRLQSGEDALYLKDWHFCSVPGNLNLFSLPEIFKVDWLNDYLVSRGKEDYRFLYFGGCKTWTPFHVDVLHSYSWSVNVSGKKRWYFLHPSHLTEEEKLNPIRDIRTDDRLFQHCFEIEQSSGEAVFVPSGWFHQVFNVETTISINHNWFNAYNIYHVFEHLKSDLTLIEKEICHLKADMGDEFNSHCQILLRANSGLNFEDFVEILRFASTNETYDSFQKETASKVLNEFSMS